MTLLHTSRLALCSLVLSTQLAFGQQSEVLIRAGEHATYSRLVIPAGNGAAWELRSFGREATLMIPGDNISFLTERIFDRIPRTRLLNIDTEISDGNTYVNLSLACDCSVDASIEGNNILLDIKDEAEQSAELVEKPENEGVERPIPRPEEIAESSSPEPDNGVPSDLAERLISQLNKAAEQGIIELNDIDPQLMEETSVPISPPEESLEVSEPLQPIIETLDGLDSVAERMQQELKKASGSDDLNNSVRITIPDELVELDPSNRPIRKNPTKNVVPAEDLSHCIDDELLDVSYWADVRPYSEQVATLQTRVFGEFDEPDPEAVLELARFYIFFGLGTEAKSLLKDVEVDQYQSDILIEIANTVEGKAYLSGGLLDKSAGCSGAVELWRTAALDTEETQPISDTDSLIDRFAELPIEVRRLVGPRLVKSFITRGQRTAANQVFSIIERAAGYHGDQHELRRADLQKLDGEFAEAEKIYWKLVYDNSEVSATAASELVQSMLARNAAIPQNVVSVLQSLAFEFRGTDEGVNLLLTTVRAKAGSNGVAEAISMSLDEIQVNQDNSDIYYEVIDTILSQTSASDLGAVQYLNLIFDNLQLVKGENITDGTKRTVASNVMAAGLPNTALEILQSLANPDSDAVRLIAAEASVRIRDPEIAIELNQAQPNDSSLAELASVALSTLGQHAAALDALKRANVDQNFSSLAFRAGDWLPASKSESRSIQLLSSFMMNSQETNPPASELDVTNPEDAVIQTVAKEEEITLKYASDVETQSSTIRKFLQETIEEM